jgi:hypothetical protein
LGVLDGVIKVEQIIYIIQEPGVTFEELHQAGNFRVFLSHDTAILLTKRLHVVFTAEEDPAK